MPQQPEADSIYLLSPTTTLSIRKGFFSSMAENDFIRAFRVGIAGPVGSGKTTLIDCLSKRLYPQHDLAVIINDISSQEDADFLVQQETLPEERIVGVDIEEHPHTAICEDVSMNLEAITDLEESLPGLELILIESGGDNLAVSFSPELVDVAIYVIDVSGGDKIPRKGGPGITRSDLLIVNKIDLAPYVGVSLADMEQDIRDQRGKRPFFSTNLKEGTGLDALVDWLEQKIKMPAKKRRTVLDTHSPYVPRHRYEQEKDYDDFHAFL